MAGTRFTASVVCTVEGQTVYDGTVEFTTADPGLITGLPVGAERTLRNRQTPETGAAGVRTSLTASAALLGFGAMLVLAARNRRVRQ